MPLTPGERLGPYEILSPVGAGGMGEVYKARDTRLDRVVAVKISRENFSERFEREARVIAALNHPNICQLYDVGPNYLVMEFVEGAPVAPVDSTRKLLDVAVQLTDGLAAAHAAGIVHRDLKPDNVLISRDGKVKILDFGLAKTVTGDSATLVTGITNPGTTMGTIAYMSPEQARGSPDLQAQSDQFSLGLILYELAAGRKAFQRGSAAEIMTAIIREDAEPLPETVPAQLRWIIERLLSKEPAERYDSTRDLYRELRQVRDRLTVNVSAAVAASPVAVRRPRPNRRWAAAVIAVAIVAGTAGWAMHRTGGLANYKFTPVEVSWENPAGAIWSPDGKAYAYIAGAAGNRRVFVRYLDSSTPTPLARDADTLALAGWSPDSKRVIVQRVNMRDGKSSPALFSVPVFGGEPDLIMPLDPGFVVPRISPDGKSLAAIRFKEGGKLELYTATPPGSPLKPYTPALEVTYGCDPEFIEFGPDSKSITADLCTGEGRQYWKAQYPGGGSSAGRIWTTLPGNTDARWAWFPNGRNLVMALQSHLWFAGLASGLGRPITAGVPSETQSQPSMSPDGRKLLFLQSAVDYMIVSASLTDGAVARVMSSAVTTGTPAWAPHRDEFVYSSRRNGSDAIWMRADDTDRPIVTEASFPAGTTDAFNSPSLSPGADRVSYVRDAAGVGDQVWISSVAGGPSVRLTNDTNCIERGGSWSPDGAQVAYWCFRDGKASVMVARSTGDATPRLLRANVGNPLPEWSPDGQWIKFRDSVGGIGWTLLSLDGKTLRSYGEPDAIQTVFSADSKHLYGIRVAPDRNTLFSLDLATKEVKKIGEIPRDFTPSSYTNPALRLSLSPDGKSILYPALRRSTSLWMLEGLEEPGWLDQIREMLPGR